MWQFEVGNFIVAASAKRAAQPKNLKQAYSK
jgi:hypothetical protein